MRKRLAARRGLRKSGELLLSVCFSALLVLAFQNPATAQQVTLAWDAPAATGITGYNIYYGTASGSYSTHTDAGVATTVIVTGLQSLYDVLLRSYRVRCIG